MIFFVVLFCFVMFSFVSVNWQRCRIQHVKILFWVFFWRRRRKSLIFLFRGKLFWLNFCWNRRLNLHIFTNVYDNKLHIFFINLRKIDKIYVPFIYIYRYIKMYSFMKNSFHFELIFIGKIRVYLDWSSIKLSKWFVIVAKGTLLNLGIRFYHEIT